MIKTLQTTLKQDKEQFKVPRSVQDTIPIRRLWPDGVFQFGSKYSKTLRFSDINYAIASKEDKTAMPISRATSARRGRISKENLPTSPRRCCLPPTA